VSNTLGPVAPASTPPLANLPTLTISAVGGLSAPATPSGSYTTADLTLPTATVNPVPITIAATNVPVGTLVTIAVLPPDTFDIVTVSAPTTGTFASSTATASLNLPYGRISLLYVYASCSQVAGLSPSLDGETVERVMVAAAWGEPSTVTLVTGTGKVKRAEGIWPNRMRGID
jgi:hypothetical protein